MGLPSQESRQSHPAEHESDQHPDHAQVQDPPPHCHNDPATPDFRDHVVVWRAWSRRQRLAGDHPVESKLAHASWIVVHVPQPPDLARSMPRPALSVVGRPAEVFQNQIVLGKEPSGEVTPLREPHTAEKLETLGVPGPLPVELPQIGPNPLFVNRSRIDAPCSVEMRKALRRATRQIPLPAIALRISANRST